MTSICSTNCKPLLNISSQILRHHAEEVKHVRFLSYLIRKWNLHHSPAALNTRAVASEDISKLFFNNCTLRICLGTAQSKHSPDKQAKPHCKILQGKRCRVRSLAWSSAVFANTQHSVPHHKAWTGAYLHCHNYVALWKQTGWTFSRALC